MSSIYPVKFCNKIAALSISLLFIALITNAQDGQVKGTIRTSDGLPAASVNVQLKEVKKGVASADDGTYTLSHIRPGKYTIIVSFVGLQTVQRVVEIAEGEVNNIDFTLSENASELSEIVIIANRTVNEKPVTIGKLPVKPMDLPQSVAIVGRETLERQQVLRLSEALMNTTGIYQMGNTGGGQEEIAGRGYAFSSSNTFKNGTRYNNAAMPEMSALEKVEVLKGSAAILFGNVAAGGILNLVTKKPKFETGGEISFRTGSYDFYKPAFDLYGPANHNKTIAYRVNGTYEKAASFRDAVHSERFYVNPSLQFNAGKKTTILLEGDYLKDDRTSDFGTGAVNYVVADIPRSRFLGATWSYYNTNQATATLTVTHHLNNNWDIRSTTSYQNFNSDLYGTTRPNASSQFVQQDGKWIRGLQRSGTNEKYYITQLDFTGHFNTGGIKHTLLIGADADRYITDSKAYSYTNAAANNKNVYDSINIYDLTKYQQRSDIPDITPITISRVPVRRYGIYIQDLIAITEKVKLLAGVRYTNQQTSKGYVDSLAKNTRTNSASTSDDAFTPRFGIVYQPWKTISVFTSYSNSFTLNTGTDIYLKPLTPSYINQYEAGVKTELFKKNLSVNVTAYKIVNSNLAQMALLDANGNTNSNTNIKELAGEVTSKGVELDIATKQFYGFQVLAGYSFNQTKYTKSNTYIVGSKLRYNPEHTANLSVYYSFDNRSFLKGFNVGILSYYIGERVAGRSTRVQVTNDTYKLMPLPDYMQFDASVGYAVKKLSVRFKLSNIFDKLSYYVHDDNSVNPIAPRGFSATISYRL